MLELSDVQGNYLAKKHCKLLTTRSIHFRYTEENKYMRPDIIMVGKIYLLHEGVNNVCLAIMFRLCCTE